MRMRIISWNAAIATALVALLGAGCDVPSTFSPDVQIATNMPLLEERVEIGDKIDNTESIRINPDDPEELELHLTEEEISLGGNGSVGGSRMAVDDQTPEESGVEVGLISVDDVPPATTPSSNLSDLAPLVNSLPNGTTVNLPAMDAPTASEQVDFENIQSVTFSSTVSPDLNRIEISISNHTPLTMGTVEIFLSNSGDTLSTGEVQDVYAQVVLNNVAPNDSVTADPIVLNGVQVLSPTHVVTRVAFDAGINVPTNDLKAGYFTVTVDISELEVESAVAKIPAQRSEEIQQKSFASQRLALIEVELASVFQPDSNKYSITFRNDILTDINLTYNIPDFVIPTMPTLATAGVGNLTQPQDADPNDWSRGTIGLVAGQETEVMFDLDGALMSNADNPGEPIDNLEIRIAIDILGTGDNFVTVNATDSVKVTTDLSALAIQRVEGRIDPIDPEVINIEPFDFTVEENTPEGLKAILPVYFLSQLNLASDSLSVDAVVTLNMSVPYPSELNPTTYVREIIGHFTPGGVVTFSTTEDSTGTGGNAPLDIVEALLESVFESGIGTIDVDGTISMSGPVLLVRDESRVRAVDMVINSPLIFEVPALTFDGKAAEDTAFDISLDESIREDFITRAKGAALVVHLQNHFPLGGKLVMFMSSDPRLVRLRADYPAQNEDLLVNIPETLPTDANISDVYDFEARKGVYKLFRVDLPRPTRLADGSVDHDNPGDSTLVVTLNEAEIGLFQMESAYLLPRVQLFDAPGLVQLRPDDYVDVSLWMQLKATTKK